jgi:hypothetical protein
LFEKPFTKTLELWLFGTIRLAIRCVEEFAGFFKGKAADDESERKRPIESLDISGNAAIAKLMADYPDARYFEYLALLKIGDEWKIVNNVFYGEPKPPKQK